METIEKKNQKKPFFCPDCGIENLTTENVNCPQCGKHLVVSTPVISWTRSPSLPPMLYPNAYVWFIFLSAMDIMLTWVLLLMHPDGHEVNPVANAVIRMFGLGGMVLFKFSLVVFVVIMCEWVGRKNSSTGKRLSEWAVAITSIPVVVTFSLLIAGM